MTMTADPIGQPVVIPSPVPPHIDLHLKDILSQIPSDKRGTATVTATTTGFEGAVGQRFSKGRLAGQLSAYGATEWGSGAWSAGVRASATW